MRAHRGPGTVAAAAALCLALAAAGPAAATPGGSATPADGGSLEVRELTGSAIPLDDLAPGDTVDWAAEVTNVSAAGSPLSVRLDSMRSMALTGDALGGVQLSVRLCEEGFVTLAPPMRCRGTVEPLGSGPAATLQSVVTRTPLDAGESVGIAVRVRFPAEADNRMERTAGLLSIGFALVDGPGTGAGAAPGSGTGTGTGTGTGSEPAGSAPAAGSARDLLPVTGRDIASAVVGALLALLGGALLVRSSRRRRRRAPGTAS
ncbi:sortase [Clavibacter capsici]|uniref:sortase n=1 Tax=Clavibacter capsici TaxID=1874630 RepID=UPI0014287638|nr:sortase [Clavibacter capsici]QIS37981.1 sortase [Clavibacter capsici]